MSRLLPLLFFVSLLVSPTPSLAKTKIIVQRSSKLNSIVLQYRLRPAHSYRLEVVAQKRMKFTGVASEFYAFVSNHRFFTQSKSVPINGTTPHSVTLKQPIPQKLGEWSLTASVQIMSGSGSRFTMRLVDLGKGK